MRHRVHLSHTSKRPERNTGFLGTQLESHPHVIGLERREAKRGRAEEVLPSGRNYVKPVKSALVDLNLQMIR